LKVEILYNMARAAAQGATRACEADGGKMAIRYGGYPAYVAEYNRLIPLVVQEFGEEAKYLFQPIDLGKHIHPSATIGTMWRTYLEQAAARLNALEAYLRSKIGVTDERLQSVLDLINANLRASIFQTPEREKEIQNALEVIFRARGLEFCRETSTIKYSSKTFVPDFTFETLDLALEVKLCKTALKRKSLIDEINADIPAYRSRYRFAVFVVYDLGFIRDVSEFKSGIEGNPDVHVLVVKE